MFRAFWWETEKGHHNPFSPNGGGAFTYSAANVAQYVVEGSGNFPMDMLRYDRAFCLTPIPHPDHDWPRKYRVVVGFEGKYRPTIARWESFGWQVGPAINQVVSLVTRAVSWRGKCHRCNKVCTAYALSIFNKNLLCPHCEAKEREHPDFKLARDTLRYHFKREDYKFMGIGFEYGITDTVSDLFGGSDPVKSSV